MIATNREVRHEYFVVEALETGIELIGTEVKSLRAGGVNLKDTWVDIEDGELIAKGIHISPYEQGNIFNRTPCASGGFWRTKVRFGVCTSSASCRAIRWCRSRFISNMAA